MEIWYEADYKVLIEAVKGDMIEGRVLAGTLSVVMLDLSQSRSLYS